MSELNDIERAILARDLAEVKKALEGKILDNHERGVYFSQGVHNGDDKIASYFAAKLTDEDMHCDGRISQAIKTAAKDGYVGVFKALKGQPRLYLGLRDAAFAGHRDVAKEIIASIGLAQVHFKKAQKGLVAVVDAGWSDLVPDDLPYRSNGLKRAIERDNAKIAAGARAFVANTPGLD